MSDSAETIADRYTVIESLGEGGMGTVYLAQDTQLNRTVAIKILRAEMTDDAAMRFQKEAKAIGKLRHGAILTALDFGVSQNGQPYLILDYLEGETLDKVLESAGGLIEMSLAVDIAERICEGLAYAHTQGVIHRDIKPSNIFLIGCEPCGDAVKILDFGIARFTSEDQHLTATGSIVGSPPYMSPEQARGERVDERSDIYSVGCVLFEMLTGRPPLRGASAIETMALKNAEDAPFLSQKAPQRQFPPRLEEIVGKCLRRGSDQRYSSIAAMEADLNGVREAVYELEALEAEAAKRAEENSAGKHATIGSAGIRERVVSFCKNKFVMVGALVSLLVMGVASFVISGNQPAPPVPMKMSTACTTNPMQIIDADFGAYSIEDGGCTFRSMPNLNQVKTAAKEMKLRAIKLAEFDAVFGALPPEFLRELKPLNLEVLNLAHAELTSDALAAINDLDSLRTLKFSECKHTGVLFRQPEKMANIDNLTIGGDTLSAADQDSIRRLPTMKYLDIGRCNGVTTEFLRSLKDRKELELLTLGSDDTTKEQVEVIAELKSISRLVVTKLNGSLLCDAVRAASKLPLLRIVSVSECKSSPELFECLAKVRALTFLGLDRVSGVTRSDLLKLKDLKHLTQLEFDRSTPENPEDLLAVLNFRSLLNLRVSAMDDLPPDVASQLKRSVKEVTNTY